MEGRARSYSLRVFYEKARIPVIDIPQAFPEDVRFPQLMGKGKEVMSYLVVHPELARDPLIQRFDESKFHASSTSTSEATAFANLLFKITNEQLPGAEVSSAHDCAELTYRGGFQWIDDLGRPQARN